MATPNRFLVVVRAGDQSLHPAWTTDLATRNWDLVVSYFGSDPGRYRNPGEIRIDDPGQKFAGLHALLTREDFWRDYDYLWIPDDDLAIEQSAISELFAIAERLQLALAQPALTWTSFYSHFITIRHPSFRVRMTNFVEVMAPCFQREFLQTCLPTFTENLSGWGLDWLWPRLLPETGRRCAVIDEVAMTHTRPVGGPTYDKLGETGVTPYAELHGLMRKFGIPGDVQALLSAAIDKQGRLLDSSQPEEAAILRQLLTRDRAEFKAFRERLTGDAIADAAQPPRVVHQGPTIKWRQ